MYSGTFAPIENDRTRDVGQAGHVLRADSAGDGFVSLDEYPVADRPARVPGRRRSHTKTLVPRSLPDPPLAHGGYVG